MSAIKTVELPASKVPAGATLLYRGQIRKAVRVENSDRKWVKFIEADGHVIYRRVNATVTVKATPKTLQAAA